MRTATSNYKKAQKVEQGPPLILVMVWWLMETLLELSAGLPLTQAATSPL